MPLYCADFLGDTMHLNAAQTGAYLLLIMHLWTRGSLPDDNQQLARIARCAPNKWPAIRKIIEPFFSPGWRHKRVEAEFHRASNRVLMNRAKALKRWDPNYAGAMHPGKKDILTSSSREDAAREASGPEIKKNGASAETIKKNGGRLGGEGRPHEATRAEIEEAFGKKTRPATSPRRQ